MGTNDSVPCIGCHTNCCWHYVVPVTAHDIHRIASTLHVSPATFLELRTTKDGSGVHLDGGYFQIALRKDEQEACVFLLTLGNDNRCAIQSFKPRVCAIYPFTLDDDDKLWHRNDMLCPTPWTLSWRAQQETRADIRQSRAERQFYDDLVARWNEEHPSGGPFGEYVDFIFGMVARAQGETK